MAQPTDSDIREILRKHDWRDRDANYWDSLERHAVDPELKHACRRNSIDAERKEAYYSNWEFL